MPEMIKDLVLSPNTYAYVLDETKGNVSCWVGPAKTSLSTSDRLVKFDEIRKEFVHCDYDSAIKLFITAPENWYVMLKNPVKNNKHPNVGAANSLPEEMDIGRKINISGPTSFALFPGQMAKVVKGHTLRTNQYLLARVYDAETATNADGKVINVEGQETKIEQKYVTGQILVIKGTEVSFYIPPTGIEIIPVEGKKDEYVRDAITLERLEYCILKDEDGNKRYVHGPEVVFPEATETFVANSKDNYIFRAIELSKISGIYIKVIAEYTDEKKVVHPIGEELFITGNEQMIYYPRPEHAIINYDNKIIHHATAIPKGEGRYVMNRLTGEIKTVTGPAMYLPDPRTEVIVKRKLTASQCDLWFPGNIEAKMYNEALNEKAVEKSMQKGLSTSNWVTQAINCSNSINATVTMDSFESNASISRGTSYTKPRTITLDNKYDGVVSMDIWTGYAVNVISKNGDRKIVCGPQTILLDYDQTLDILQLSTGKPKTTDNLVKTVFLRHENNKVSDLITIETKDFVKATVKVSYCVDFLLEHQDKWFAVDNYIKYLCDRQRSLMKREAKKYTIEEFYQNYTDIIRNVAIDKKDYSGEENAEESLRRAGRFFPENGMLVHDVEVLSLHIENEIDELMTDHQYDMVRRSLELSNAEKVIEITEKLTEAEKLKQKLRNEELLNKMELQRVEALRKLEIQADIARMSEEESKAAKEAEEEMQVILDNIQKAKLARQQAERDAEIAHKEALAKIEENKQKVYAETVKSIIESISPDLVAAMTSKSNAEMTTAIAESLAPYALANGSESVSDVVNKLLRGTSLENIVDGVTVNV